MVSTDTARAARFRLAPMGPRDPDENGRAASTLELFFDLVFVVAVGIAAVQLHHALTEARIAHGLASYAIVFFAIWWAWMNFTWFASSFDTDDWLYRVLTIVQMSGVLVLAAGIDKAFNAGNFTVMVAGYVVMRLAMVTQWLRASRVGGALRNTTLTYATGITVVQMLWLLQLLLPASVRPTAIVVLVGAELAIPVIAERRQQTPWHRHHITERYGLFTLILLGESLLSSTNAIIEALNAGEALTPLISLGVLTFVVTAGLWWVYFWPPHHEAIGSLSRSLLYGYGHYFVFAAAGAFSAGVEVEIDSISHHSELGPVAASFTVTIPVAVFLFGVWVLVLRLVGDRVVNVAVPVAALVVLLDPIIPVPITLTSVVMVVLVAILVMRQPLPRTVLGGVDDLN